MLDAKAAYDRAAWLTTKIGLDRALLEGVRPRK